jgi:hypothetical protein
VAHTDHNDEGRDDGGDVSIMSDPELNVAEPPVPFHQVECLVCEGQFPSCCTSKHRAWHVHSYGTAFVDMTGALELGADGSITHALHEVAREPVGSVNDDRAHQLPLMPSRRDTKPGRSWTGSAP